MSSNCSKSTQIEDRDTMEEFFNYVMEEIITKDSTRATMEEIITKESSRATMEEM